LLPSTSKTPAYDEAILAVGRNDIRPVRMIGDQVLKQIPGVINQREKELLALLEAPGSVKRKLRKVCDKATEESVTVETRRGCFMNNAFVDMVTRDQQTEEQAVRHVTIVEKAWEKAFARGQESGEITKKHSASALARYFYNALNGLRVTAKTNTDENALKDIVKVTLSMFYEKDGED
jgi:TetR/AcrR family transcriptional repressor of nem operon